MEVLVENLLAVLVGFEDGRGTVENVDLLEGETAGLGDDKVDKDKAENTARSPNVKDVGSEVGISGSGVDEVRSRVTAL